MAIYPLYLLYPIEFGSRGINDHWINPSQNFEDDFDLDLSFWREIPPSLLLSSVLFTVPYLAFTEIFVSRVIKDNLVNSSQLFGNNFQLVLYMSYPINLWDQQRKIVPDEGILFYTTKNGRKINSIGNLTPQ